MEDARTRGAPPPAELPQGSIHGSVPARACKTARENRGDAGGPALRFSHTLVTPRALGAFVRRVSRHLRCTPPFIPCVYCVRHSTRLCVRLTRQGSPRAFRCMLSRLAVSAPSSLSRRGREPSEAPRQQATTAAACSSSCGITTRRCAVDALRRAARGLRRAARTNRPLDRAQRVVFPGTTGCERRARPTSSRRLFLWRPLPGAG
jgi:hypothetical protein